MRHLLLNQSYLVALIAIFYHQGYYKESLTKHFNPNSGKTMKILRGGYLISRGGGGGWLLFAGEIKKFKISGGGLPYRGYFLGRA